MGPRVDHRRMNENYFMRIVRALDRAHERRMTRPASILPGELGHTLTGSPLARRGDDDPGR
jgi:hypothetical protein